MKKIIIIALCIVILAIIIFLSKYFFYDAMLPAEMVYTNETKNIVI